MEIKKSIIDGITSPEIEELYEIARKRGAIGGKVLGAGGGGHLYLFCRCGERQKVVDKLSEYDVDIVSFQFEHEGLKTEVV